MSSATKVNVNVLSFNESEPLTFAKISELQNMNDISLNDFLIVSGTRNSREVTRNVKIQDIAQFFQDVNTTAQWFIPVVNGSVINWEWSDVIPEDGIPSMDLLTIIPTATTSNPGLMSALDKAKLESVDFGVKKYVLEPATDSKLGGVMVDGITVNVDENGVLSAVTGIPILTERVLYAEGWDRDTKTQKVSLTVDTNNRNVIDYPPAYIQIVSQHHVLAIREESDGIIFQCDTIPINDITVYVTSMGVINNDS